MKYLAIRNSIVKQVSGQITHVRDAVDSKSAKKAVIRLNKMKSYEVN